MKEKTKKYVIPMVGAITIGFVHGLAHYIFGNPASFADAAVTSAGTAVVIASAVVITVAREYL